MRKKSGITLIETLISLTIVSLSVLALMPIMTIRKESNDLSRGNRYWIADDTNAYYQAQASVAIGTTTPNEKFILDATGFKNSTLLPLNVTERLDWDGQITDEIVLFRRELSSAHPQLSNQYIAFATHFNEEKKVYYLSFFLNNNPNATTSADNNTLEIDSSRMSFPHDINNPNKFLISNAGTDYIHLHEIKRSVGIGIKAGSNLPDESIAIYKHNNKIPVEVSNIEQVLAIGLKVANNDEYDFSTDTDWVIHKIGTATTSDFSINAAVVAGPITASAVIPPSDERLKNILRNYTRGLDEILKINPVEFTYKNDENQRHHIGVIAQDLKKVLPEAVSKNSEGYYMVSTEPIFYSYINAIKELNNKNLELKTNNDELEEKIAKLKKIKSNLEKGGNDEK